MLCAEQTWPQNFGPLVTDASPKDDMGRIHGNLSVRPDAYQAIRPMVVTDCPKVAGMIGNGGSGNGHGEVRKVALLFDVVGYVQRSESD